MPTKQARSLFALLLAFALVAAACGGDDTDTDAATETTAGGSESEAAGGEPTETGTIKFGSILSRSGQLAAIAPPFVDGVELAVAQINEEGGIVVGNTRYEVELLLEDDRSDAGVATAAVTGLIEDEEVKFVIGPGTSVTAPAVAQLAVPQGVLMFTPSTAVAPMLTPELVKSTSRTLFLTQPSVADLQAKFQEGLEAAYPDAARVAVLMPDNAIGKAVAPIYRAAAEGVGAEVVAVESYPAGSTDVSTPLTRIRGEDPDVLMAGVSVPEVNAVVKQTVELDAAPAIFTYNGSLNTPLVDATGSPIDRPFVSVGLPATLETLKSSGEVIAPIPGVSKFASDMESVLGRKPAPYATPAFYLYDFTRMLARAIEEAGTVDDTAKIAETLAAMKYEGAIGPFTFSETHTVQPQGDVCTVEAGQVQCELLAAG